MKTVGLISNCLWSVQQPEWLGMSDVAKQHDINLLCYIGRELNSKVPHYAGASYIYNLVDKSQLDGLIISTGCIGWMTSREDMEAFCKSFLPLPLVSIEVPFPGIPSVEMEDKKGIREMVVHLIKVHGYKRIGFICGPENSQVAQLRYEGFLETMAEFGLSVDPRLVVSNKIGWSPEESFIHDFWEATRLKPKVDVEALVAASDGLAGLFQKAMQNRGIKVPDEIATTGFDNTTESRSVLPSITTVHTPHYEIGRRAMELILEQIEGTKVEEKNYVNLKPVIRQSCGCASEAISKVLEIQMDRLHINKPAQSGDALSDLEQFSRVIERNRDDLLAAINGVIQDDIDYLDAAWASSVLDGFVSDLVAKTSLFLENLHVIFNLIMKYERDSALCQKIISVLHGHTLPLLSSTSLLIQAEILWQQARVLIGEIAQKSLSERDWATERYVMLQYDSDQELATTFEMSKLMDNIAKRLPLQGIGRCYISQYDDPGNLLQSAHVILAYDEQGAVATENYQTHFDPRELIPQPLRKKNERFEYIVESLYFEREQLGFIVFDSRTRREGVFYDIQRLQISNALKRVKLVEQIESQKQELTRANDELKNAYVSLKNNQQKLISSEKMASLGRLSAGIAHEMNTPFAAVRAALKEIEGLTEEYDLSIDNKEILPSDHHAIAADIKKYISIAEQAAQKSARYIRGIKAQTSRVNNLKSQTFFPEQVIQDTLTVLEFALKRGNCILDVAIDGNVEIFGNPYSLGQIITNLVTNAIDACAPDGGKIKVRCIAREKDEIELSVSDTGCGISEEDRGKIFEPLFTTKPFGMGTGLGLTIVRELVDEFSGKLSFESQPGRTVFKVVFPRVHRES